MTSHTEVTFAPACQVSVSIAVFHDTAAQREAQIAELQHGLMSALQRHMDREALFLGQARVYIEFQALGEPAVEDLGETPFPP